MSKRGLKVQTLISVAAIGGLIAVIGSQAFAQEQRESPGERAVEYRQSLMTVLAGNFGPVAAMAGGKMPFNAALAKKDADRVAFIATMAPDAFPANSNGAGKTKAKPNIWTDQADFQKHAQELLDKTAALQMAADSGDQAGIKSAATAVGMACKGCHDNYRAK
jgi:cytochrome c556